MNQSQYVNNVIVDDKYGIKELPQSQDLFLHGNYINPNLTKKIVNKSFDSKRPYSTAIIGCNNTSLSDKKLKYPFWTAHDAEENYLSSKPTCFLILGKEGCGATDLGEKLAQHWKCLHLNPEKLIKDEMEQNSLTGKCMDFNLRHNKPLTSDILLTILSAKLNSPIVKHRGYVLTGFPLVNTAEKVAELQSSYYSEIALTVAFEIINEIVSSCILVKPKKKSRQSDFNDEENLEEEVSIPEEIVDEMLDNEENDDFEKDAITLEDLKRMSLLETCKDIIKKRTKISLVGLKSLISKQLFHIFNLPLAPDVVIYVTCPDEDIVTKQEHSNILYPYMDAVTLPFTAPAKSTPDIRWPIKYSIEEKLKIPKTISSENHKYYTKLPTHFRMPVLLQMCNYNKFVLPLIEREFTKYDPNLILKVDGRYTVDAMLEAVLSRLTNLPVTPTLIPSTLLKYMQETLLDYAENDGENPIPDDYVEFWNFVEGLTPFHLPSSIQFTLSSSLWHNKCPVQLSLGRNINGKTKFAAVMFNKVYLLSTKEHLIEFCKNPRPYLKLEHLKLTCRILILGTKSSGKSSVAVLLKWLLNGDIVNFNDIVDDQKSKKFKAYATSIFDLISSQIEQQRLSEWEKNNSARKDELNKFLDKKVQEAKKYMIQYEKTLKRLRKTLEEKKQAMGEDGEDNFSGEEENDFEDKNSFEVRLCRQILENRANALSEAPQYLTETLPKPPPPKDGDEDVNQLVTKHIADNDALDEITPAPEDVVKALTTAIKTIEENNTTKTDGKYQYGRWIVDGFSASPEYWQILMESGIIPDEIICLVDDREIDEETYMASYNLLKNPQYLFPQQYVNIDDPLIQMKLSHNLNIPETMEAHSAAKQSEYPTEKVEMNKLENEIAKLESLNEFREQWATSKAILEESGKIPIEIIVGEIDILQIMSEVVRFLRIHMNKPCEPYETGEQSEDAASEQSDNEIKYIKEDNRFLGDMGLYCPVAYLTHGVLWKGKSEFATKFDNKIYFFSSEENLEKFKADPTRFLNTSNPYKQLPPPRICVVGSQGAGRSSVSKFIADELGIFHIDFSLIVNEIILPPHFKKVGKQFENIFTDNLYQPDEEGEEAERVEDEEADDISFLFKNEKLFRKRVYDYFEQGTPLPIEILRNAIKQLWFTEPYLSQGFVLDGFPLLPSDVESMISICAVPDFIIELSAESETIVSRLFPIMFDKWKKQQDAAMKESGKKFKSIHDEWRKTIQSSVLVQFSKKDIDSTINSKVQKSMKNIHSDDDESEETNNLYEDALANNPEPIDTSEWETIENAEARIEARIDNVYQMQVDNVKSLQEIFTESQIDWFSVDGSMPLSKLRRVPVPDERFDYLCEYHKPLSKVPAFLNVVDIAGLVKGAAEGQGLGNAFLSHIKACDAIFNLCRAFDDEDVIHVDGEVNPVRDLETIGEELRLKDEEQLLQNLDKLERVVARGGDKKLKPEYDALLKIKGVLVDEKKHIRFGDWTTNEIEILNRYLFLTSKPALYLVNLSEKDYIRKKNKWLPKLKEWVDKNDPGALLIPFSGAYETKLLDMEPDQRAAYLKEHNVTSALDKIIVNGYKALQLEYFFTAGPDEVKAWTVQKGTKAPQAAGRIHTDFEKGFIMAEVMHYKDFKEEGSEAAAKSAGKYRQQGRNYTVEDGDIIFFKFNAGAGLKDAKKK